MILLFLISLVFFLFCCRPAKFYSLPLFIVVQVRLEIVGLSGMFHFFVCVGFWVFGTFAKPSEQHKIREGLAHNKRAKLLGGQDSAWTGHERRDNRADGLMGRWPVSRGWAWHSLFVWPRAQWPLLMALKMVVPKIR